MTLVHRFHQRVAGIRGSHRDLNLFHVIKILLLLDGQSILRLWKSQVTQNKVGENQNSQFHTLYF